MRGIIWNVEPGSVAWIFFFFLNCPFEDVITAFLLSDEEQLCSNHHIANISEETKKSMAMSEMFLNFLSAPTLHEHT